MKHTIIIVALALAAALTVPAQAQNGRSFVSAHGLDSNPCTLAAPCRTFAVAFTHTNAGGEIDVLDTAGYGPLTINKAISIVNDGSVASVLVPSGGNGITITAGASDAVSLRGLTIEGAGVGQYGIVFSAGKSLTIENGIVRHLTSSGIKIAPTTSSKVAVSNTIVADNGGDGITVRPPGGTPTVSAVFNRVESYNNAAAGIAVSSDLMALPGALDAITIDSVAGYNDIGFYSAGNSQPIFGVLMVFRSVAFGNGTVGVRAGPFGQINVSQSNVEKNTSPWSQDGNGFFNSYGDNYSNTVAAPGGTIGKN